MSTFFAATLLCLTALQADAGPKLDGKWLVVYAEEGGRRNNAWEQQLATIKGSTLTYDDSGKQRTLQLKFGQHQTVEATREGQEKPVRGVCIAGQDYLSISLEAPEGKKSGAQERGSSGDFILILRKQVARD
jgi:hypothetical protein